MSTLHDTGYLATTASLNRDGSVRGNEDNLPVVGRGVYIRSLLERAQPELLHQRFGQQKPLTQRSGQTIVFRRYEKLAQATTPLTEGVTPTGTALTKTDYTATVKQYGNYIPITDWVTLTHVDPIIQETSELMGENMGETMDSVYREVLVTGTNVYYVAEDASSGSGDTGHWASGAARANVAATLCKGVFDGVIRNMRGQNAKPFEAIIPGSAKISTYPVGQSFWALMHTDLEHDLFRSANSGMTLGEDFTPIERYSGFKGTMMTEVGKYRNIRFVTSTNAKVWEQSGATTASTASGMKTSGTSGTSDADVYAVLIFARDAYGIVPLQRGSATILIQRPGGPSDPLEQRTTVGWKAAGTAIILNDAWMARMECTTLE